MLSENKAKAAKSRQKAYKLSDSARLYLFITPSGGNLWSWNYVYDGKQKAWRLGRFRASRWRRRARSATPPTSSLAKVETPMSPRNCSWSMRSTLGATRLSK